jgi:hypothetical protein
MKDSNLKLLEKEVLPFLKEKLISSEDKNVLRESCWVLSYIADDIDGIQAIILDADLCRNLVVKLLRDSSESVLYPALRTVSNIFAGCTVTTIPPEYNDKEFQSVIGADIIWTLVDLMKVKDDISCRLEKGLLLFLKKILIHSTDEDALRVACTALSYISDDLYIVKGMFDAVVRGRLVYFLCGSSDCILYPALRTVSNIFNGSYHLIEGMINAGALSALVKILKEDFWEYIKLEACVAILHISRSNNLPGLAKSVISAGIFPPLNLLLTKAPLRTRVQVAHAFYCMTDGESGCHTESLVKEGCMEAMCKALSYSDPILVIFCLRCVENILKDGKLHSSCSENSYVKEMKFKGFEEISKLEGDDNKKISRIAVSIRETYCGVEGSHLS